MHHTNKDIFWKCWLWSAICGAVVAVLFWFISDIGSLFHGKYGGTVFIDLLLGLSVLGSYFGAGFVGWRIVDRYYPSTVKAFLKSYKRYSLFSFILLVAIIYSPLSILAIFWSVLAPYCVIVSLSKAKKTVES